MIRYLLFALLLAATVSPCPAFAGITTRASVASDGTQGNRPSWDSPSFSADGRYVAFSSEASNLVPEDTNGWADIFVHDRLTGQTERVSVASDGAQGNAASSAPSISANGRYVAFMSSARLVPEDTNGWADIFVYDRMTGHTTRISVASDGTQGNADCYSASISADGRFVAFRSYANNLVPGYTGGIFVHDCTTGQTERISMASDGTQANNQSYYPSISADGRYVAFGSYASNLVPGDTNGVDDIFVHDRLTGQTERISVASDGTQANNHSDYPSISADGRYVAFYSSASNLVSGDTNGAYDIFIHDRLTGQTERVSIASDGTQGNAASFAPSISGDGRHVAFESYASTLVPGDTNGRIDAFVHDRVTGNTDRVSVASDGTQGGAESNNAAISADGRCVGFLSASTNLVPGDTNGVRDIFVHDRTIQSVTLTSDQPSPQLLGETVTFSAVPTDGFDVEYQFWVRKCWEPYQLVQEYSAQSSYTWTTPNTPGKYAVLVYAREAGTNTVKSDSLFYTVAAPLSAVNLQASTTAPQVGQPLTLTAIPTGGKEVEYEFWVRKCWDPYARWQGFGTRNTTNWMPPAPGRYAVLVYAREAGTTSTVSDSLFLTVTYPPVQVVTLTADPGTEAAVGTTITLTANVPKDTLPVEYEFWVRKGWAPYQLLQAYSGAGTATWRPQLTGTYTVLVYARRPGSTRNEASTFIKYTITSP